MMHTARLLEKYLGESRVIDVSKLDPVLRRICTNGKALPAIRAALKELHPQNELLIPRKVDSKEKQLKRYIQLYMGTTVNLTQLRKKYIDKYNELFVYGSPRDVITRWGLDFTLDAEWSVQDIKEALLEVSEGGTEVRNIVDSNLYIAIKYRADKQNKSIAEYLSGLGFNYTGGYNKKKGASIGVRGN